MGLSNVHVSDIVSAITSEVKDNSGFSGADVKDASAPADGSAPVQASADEAPAPAQAAEAPQGPQDLAELFKDKSFKLDGREMTLEEFRKGFLRQDDYTKKTQELAAFKKEHESFKKDQEYYSALINDVKKVEQDPKLLEQFYKAYPDKFHQYVTHVQQQQPLTEERIQKLIEQRINNEINPLKESMTQKEADSIAATFEAWDKEFEKQYPEAQINLVYNMIEKARDQGTPVNRQLWEQAWKSSHDMIEGRINQRVSAKLSEKQKLNVAGKDIKQGGGAPSQPVDKGKLKDSGRRLMEYLATQN